MNGFEILEALTDIDDAHILQADEPPLSRGPQRSFWHGLIAACLTLVLLTTAVLGSMGLSQDTTMRYTVRYRENRVTYLCKVHAYRNGPTPPYVPTYLPQGYVYDRESNFGDKDVFITYRNTEESMQYISFSYVRVTDTYKTDLYTLPMGSYDLQEVTVNGHPGQLYLYTGLRTGGELIWVDTENCLLLRIDFPTADPTDAIKMANSVRKTDR